MTSDTASDGTIEAPGTGSYHHGDLPNALRAAAAEIISDAGLAGFSLREVARRAGVSHAAPAHHFGDARGLLTSLAKEGFTILAQQMLNETADIDDPVEALHRIGETYVTFALTYPGHIAVMFRRDAVNEDDDELLACGDAAHDLLIATVERVMGLRHQPGDVEVAAALCWAAMQGLVDLYPVMTRIAEEHPERPSFLPGPTELTRLFSQMLLDGLLPASQR